MRSYYDQLFNKNEYSCCVCNKSFCFSEVEKCFSCNNQVCKSCRFLDEKLILKHNTLGRVFMSDFRICNKCEEVIGFNGNKEKARKFIAQRKDSVIFNAGNQEADSKPKSEEHYFNRDVFESQGNFVECNDCKKSVHIYSVDTCTLCNQKSCYKCKSAFHSNDKRLVICNSCINIIPEWVLEYKSHLANAVKSFGSDFLKNLNDNDKIKVVLENEKFKSSYFATFNDVKSFEKFLFDNWVRDEDWFIAFVITPKREIRVGRHLEPSASWKNRISCE